MAEEKKPSQAAEAADQFIKDYQKSKRDPLRVESWPEGGEETESADVERPDYSLLKLLMSEISTHLGEHESELPPEIDSVTGQQAIMPFSGGKLYVVPLQIGDEDCPSLEVAFTRHIDGTSTTNVTWSAVQFEPDRITAPGGIGGMRHDVYPAKKEGEAQETDVKYDLVRVRDNGVESNWLSLDDAHTPLLNTRQVNRIGSILEKVKTSLDQMHTGNKTK